MARIDAEIRPHKGQNAKIHFVILSTDGPIEVIVTSFLPVRRAVARIHAAIDKYDLLIDRIPIAIHAPSRSVEVIALLSARLGWSSVVPCHGLLVPCRNTRYGQQASLGQLRRRTAGTVGTIGAVGRSGSVGRGLVPRRQGHVQFSLFGTLIPKIERTAIAGAGLRATLARQGCP